MKRHGHLFERGVSFDNLLAAYYRARKGKRNRLEVRKFGFHLETRLLQIRRDLLAGSYRFGPYRAFRVFDPKPREILAAPFRDRVVHWAIVRVIEPLLDPTLVHDCFACREGRGNLAAVLKLRHHLRACPEGYVLQCDVSRYFPSVDHEILLALFAGKLKDRRLLELLRSLVASSPVDPAFGPGKGIPIGNLTSQLAANLYLSPLDHFVKEELRERRYLRYCDDFVVVGDDKARLHHVRAQIRAFLAGKLKLTLHPSKATVAPVRSGVVFLGYRVWPFRMRVKSATVRRFARRERRLRTAYWNGSISSEEYWHRVQSWVAFASHADSDALLCRLGIAKGGAANG